MEQKWNKTKDRLPPIDEEVLLYEKGIMAVGVYDDKGRLYSPVEYFTPTHWMPLPKPPPSEPVSMSINVTLPPLVGGGRPARMPKTTFVEEDGGNRKRHKDQA